MKSVKVFAPNTVSNVGCGYDVLGFALEGFGDEIHLEKRADELLKIVDVQQANLPTDPEVNVATVGIASLLKSVGSKQGFNVSIKKGIPPGSGLGSSACSSAGAVFAVNQLLDQPFDTSELIDFAMEGERISSGSAHADNVAPSLLGGFIAVQNNYPIDVFSVPFPTDLLAVIIYPHITVNTGEAKRMLKPIIKIDKAVAQTANMAGLINGLMASDFCRIGRSINDSIAEPIRKTLIPYYEELKNIALNLGALGFNISGSGPSMFALAENRVIAEKIRNACESKYHELGIANTSFVSPINPLGTRVI